VVIHSRKNRFKRLSANILEITIDTLRGQIPEPFREIRVAVVKAHVIAEFLDGIGALLGPAGDTLHS